MAEFQCSVCGSAFTVTPKVLAKYPGWKPRYCQEHSPKRRAASARSRPGGGGFEENLTLAQVLARHAADPTTGVFTDGSAKPNPGPGGWGVVWVEDGKVVEQRHGRTAKTTNNRMELTALIEAFRLLPNDAAVPVATDSRLCVDTITKWAPGWERKGWKKKDGEIKNLELVQELLALRREHPACELRWVAAHSGHLWNEYADSLATAWMRDEL
ncbi:MAG: ribonuclease H [Planctomycetota bacterium]